MQVQGKAFRLEPPSGQAFRCSLGAEALDRLGMIALWLSGLALISLVISAIGGMIGTPDEVLVDSTTRTESYRDMRRAS